MLSVAYELLTFLVSSLWSPLLFTPVLLKAFHAGFLLGLLSVLAFSSALLSWSLQFVFAVVSPL